MDEKLLQLLKSDDSANWLLAVQIYGEDKLLEHILNEIKALFMSDSIVKLTRIGWFQIIKCCSEDMLVSVDLPNTYFYNYKGKLEELLAKITIKYKEYIK